MNGQVKISIFPPLTRRSVVIESMGYSLDKFCTNLRTTQDLAGTFRLEATIINHKDRPEIHSGYILKHLGEVYRITSFKESTMVCSVIAYQITITDTDTVWIRDIRPTNTSCEVALNTLYDGAESFGFPKEIFLSSNISSINTAYYQNMSLHRALCDCEQSILNRWGGEIERLGYNLKIKDRIGRNNGITIREKKNLVGFQATTNIENLCTVAVGVGANGIEGDYIESPLKNNYPRPYIKTIEYSDIKVKGENDSEGFNTLDEAKIELNRRIKEEFSINNIDKIKAIYDIKLVDLSKVEEYKEYAYLERVDLGDVVCVIVDSLKIKLKTRVIEIVKDINNDVVSLRLSNNDIGEVYKSDSSIIRDIKNTVFNSNSKNFIDYITSQIKSGVKGGYMLYNESELVSSDNKDLNYAKDVVRINRKGIAFSRNGYNGDYIYGFTADGGINASVINTGILSTVMIQNADGSFKIDLSESGGANFYNNGQQAIKIANNSINFYDWKNSGRDIGFIGSTVSLDGKDTPYLSISNTPQNVIDFSYRNDEGTYSSYMKLDQYNIQQREFFKPIQVYGETNFNGKNLYRAILSSDSRESLIYTTDTGVVLKAGKNCIECNNKETTIIHNNSSIVLKDDGIHFYGQLFKGD